MNGFATRRLQLPKKQPRLIFGGEEPGVNFKLIL
jgi:hypothetical protein